MRVSTKKAARKPSGAVRDKQQTQNGKKEVNMTKKGTYSGFVMVIVLALAAVFATGSFASYTKEDKAVERVSPEEARQLVDEGKALLVCAYDDESCKSKLLQGAILRSEFEKRLASLTKDQRIIFYCG
jgi:hypothetical protein